jgi:hypothetical protein
MNTLHNGLSLYLENFDDNAVEEYARRHHGVVYSDRKDLNSIQGSIFVDYYFFEDSQVLNLIKDIHNLGRNLILVVRDRSELPKEIINRMDGVFIENANSY